MHFEILVEDISGKKALDILLPKIIGDIHTFRVMAYKGIGRIPKNMKSKTEANKRILLDQLPKLLNGYGKTFKDNPEEYPVVLFVICDLDDKCLKTFRKELDIVLQSCTEKPNTRFCIAVEEGEAWFLGDIEAVKKAYPKAIDTVLKKYKNDSICGTWELLADAIYPKGKSELIKKGWQIVGEQKSKWAENITPHMDIRKNKSPSFVYFREKLLELCVE